MQDRVRVKDEREKVENLRNKGPDGIKEWYNFIQGNNRSNEVQIHELVVDGCKVSDHRKDNYNQDVHRHVADYGSGGQFTEFI
ncbi:hypothetical protein FHG87_016150 [Trinorchestia longiramus]|nr:hypothetical protein FHG87_016150 [Trinorchestia longiramus]